MIAGVIALAAVVLVLPVPATLAAAAPRERYFHTVASTFQYTPSVIDVNPGDRVTIDLTATDVVHGLYIDDYGLNVTADPGQTARLTFVADRPGTFRLRCSAPCGSLHPFMVGKLNVGPNWLLWRAAGLAVIAVGAVLSGWWMRRG